MFKLVVLCAFVAAASAAHNFGHKQAHHQQSHHQQAYHQQAHHQSHHAAAAATSDDVHAEVKQFHADVHEHGYNYAYETTNGIAAAATGDEYGNAHGDFGWISPEGEHIAVQYVADENGYQPQSDVLPVAPAIPAAILKALEYIRTHPQQEEHGRHY